MFGFVICSVVIVIVNISIFTDESYIKPYIFVKVSRNVLKVNYNNI